MLSACPKPEKKAPKFPGKKGLPKKEVLKKAHLKKLVPGRELPKKDPPKKEHHGRELPKKEAGRNQVDREKD